MNDLRAPSPVSTVRLVWRAIQVRLRFVVILLTAFVVVGSWETIRNRGDALARRLLGSASVGFDQAVSADTEYFCPMDPGILSDWPGRCGACNMALVRRKKGEPSPGPDGVIARMQFSPYRVQLAGIQTAPIVYRPLVREVTGVGELIEAGSPGFAKAEFFERDFAMIAVGQPVSIAVDGMPAISGRVAKLDSPTFCRIEVDNLGPPPPRGARIVAKARVPMAGLEPFCSLPANPPPIHKGEPRVVFSCADHPDAFQESPGRCPLDKNVLEARRLDDNQRVAWWCPMHPSVTAAAAGSMCKACEGMKLVPRVVTYRPAGAVLAVPESAVVDTGTRRVVFVERMPGLFDAVEIVVGPRCGGEYPVVTGVASGDRVATSGALLIDAETRLNPSLAASYFGATARIEPARVATDRAVANCPVTGKALGSMGAPVSVEVEGTTVWICCVACEAALRKDPAKYLAKSARRP